MTDRRKRPQDQEWGQGPEGELRKLSHTNIRIAVQSSCGAKEHGRRAGLRVEEDV